MKEVYTIGAVLVVLVGAGLAFLLLPGGKVAICEASGSCPPQTMDVMKRSGEPYKEIVDPSGFVNTDPITIGQFIGKKVILLDFLTYSCINCQRTFPYLNAWDEKYRDQGLLIIGIHTPEFAFEKDINTVREAMQKFGITHPIVLDNDYATWNAYGNRYWPRKYLIDIHGNVVYDHIGEGAYEETEANIRELLAERAQVLGEEMGVHDGLAVDAVARVRVSARSPETYFGSDRNEYLGNGTRGSRGTQVLTAPQTAQMDTLYLEGTWEITSEYAKNVGVDARIVYRFDAADVYFVAGAEKPVEISVFVDGKYANTQTIRPNTLYTLVSGAAAGAHTLEVRIHSPGLEAYAFTFG